MPGRSFRKLSLLLATAAGCLSFLATSPAKAGPGEETAAPADTSAKAEAESLQKKATQAQVQIHDNADDRGQLMRAIKLNEKGVAKEVLLRNGFTTQELEGASLVLRSGGGKCPEGEVEISATCCDPKEITIRRCGENYIK